MQNQLKRSAVLMFRIIHKPKKTDQIRVKVDDNPQKELPASEDHAKNDTRN